MQITEQLISALRASQKRVVNPRARETEKEKHRGRDYDLTGGKEQFSLFVRQSTVVLTSFSAGLLWLPTDGSKVMLARYNGNDHPHGNTIERTRADYDFHIHTATERYASIGRKVEHYAELTDRFKDSSGALRCLLLDWNIKGLEVSPQEQLL